jgi:hypothetical protein
VGISEHPGLGELDDLLVGLSRRARLLPALVPENAVPERARLIGALERGEAVEPRWHFDHRPLSRGLFDALEAAKERARALAHALLAEAYLARLEELELDLLILQALTDPHGNKRARALGKRRFGTGHSEVLGRSLSTTARAWLDALDDEDEEPRTVPPEGKGSLAEAMRRAAAAAALVLEVRVEPRLAAGAATGEHTVFVADRRFGVRESRRLVAHEILGHAIAAHNGRKWPLALFSAGSAQAFADQEGLALVLEERAGTFDPERRRTLALRVLASDWVHDGASFGDIALRLRKEHRLSSASAVAIAERACRGSGVARDVAYLAGYLRVSAAHQAGLSLNALRSGRISLELARDLPRYRALGLTPRAPLDEPATEAVLTAAFPSA